MKNKNLLEDVEILLPVKFRWIPFSGFRGEVKNVSANQTPGPPSYFSDQPKKHKLGRGCCDLASCQRPGHPSCFSDQHEKHKLGRGYWDFASCQVSLNFVLRFLEKKLNMWKVKDDRRRTQTTDDGQRMITIVHLSLRLRCTKNRWIMDKVIFTCEPVNGISFTGPNKNASIFFFHDLK